MSSLPKQKTFTDSYLRNLSLYAFTAIICGALTGIISRRSEGIWSW